MEENESQYFWSLLERENGVKLPLYLKNILSFNHYDNALSFGQLDEQAIGDLEKFAAQEMTEYLDENADLKSFYGNYFRNPQKFKFMLGDRHLLRRLVEFVRQKDSDFWIKKESPSTEPKSFNTSLKSSSGKMRVEGDLTSAEKEVREIYTKIIERLITQGETSSIKKSGTVKESFSVDDLNLKVSVKEIYNVGELPSSFTYTSKIECYICREVKTTTKVPATDKQPSRWILSRTMRDIYGRCMDGLLAIPKELRGTNLRRNEKGNLY